MTIKLACDPPLDWTSVIAYLAPRAVPGVDTVTCDARYARTVRLEGRTGYVVVSASSARELSVVVSSGLRPAVGSLTSRLRQLFDLDTDPRPAASHLAGDPILAPLVARRPDLRRVGALDGFELAVRAVLGQAVTVAGAGVLAGRLAELAAEPLRGAPHGLSRVPLSPERLAATGAERLRRIGITRARSACLLEMARAATAGELPELVRADAATDPVDFIRRFTRLPGIGPWTAHYVALRALGWSDAFPHADLGLRKAAGGITPKQLRAAAERWRPWRAYAARHLWAASTPSNGTRS